MVIEKQILIIIKIIITKININKNYQKKLNRLSMLDLSTWRDRNKVMVNCISHQVGFMWAGSSRISCMDRASITTRQASWRIRVVSDTTNSTVRGSSTTRPPATSKHSTIVTSTSYKWPKSSSLSTNSIFSSIRSKDSKR